MIYDAALALLYQIRGMKSGRNVCHILTEAFAICHLLTQGVAHCNILTEVFANCLAIFGSRDNILLF
jgi:hypothetical protein